MLIQEDDQQLWHKIKAGDEAAFQVLFKKYYKVLAYAAYKVYPDEHKSKDHVQEVFLDLWKKRTTKEIHTSIYAFLKKAVVYKTIDYIRAQRFNFEDTVDIQIETLAPYQQMEQEELKKLIHTSVEQLPTRCRLVFFMSRFEELSHKEIAARLNISTKTVENQITKALKILRAVVIPYLGTK